MILHTILISSIALCGATYYGENKVPTKCPLVDPIDTTIHLAHESDCTKFYMCQGGRKILRECPYMDNQGNRLHFNRWLQVCDWPRDAGCKPGCGGNGIPCCSGDDCDNGNSGENPGGDNGNNCCCCNNCCVNNCCSNSCYSNSNSNYW